MRFVSLRGEDPPGETVVVIRAGVSGMTPESLRRTATASHLEYGFYGVSVFLAIDVSVEELCTSLDYLRRYSQVQESTVGRLRAAAFALLATEARPHFDVVLPDLDDSTLDRLRSCFSAPHPNPGRS